MSSEIVIREKDRIRVTGEKGRGEEVLQEAKGIPGDLNFWVRVQRKDKIVGGKFILVPANFEIQEQGDGPWKAVVNKGFPEDHLQVIYPVHDDLKR